MILFAIIFGSFFMVMSIFGIAATISGLHTREADFAPMAIFLFVFCAILFFHGNTIPTQESVSKVYYSTSLDNIEFSELKKITEIEVTSTNPLVFLKNETKYRVEEIAREEL